MHVITSGTPAIARANVATMRVIGGIAKGRTLRAPTGRTTRPTSDAVREAIFNVLTSAAIDLDGAAVADLFAGSGALGIEALSRGASHCTFVESDPKAIAVIEANLATIGFAKQATIARRDVERWLRINSSPFEVVFADPPYAFEGWETLGARLDAAIVVAESDREVDLGPAWQILRVKWYGSTVVTLFTPREFT